MVIRTAPTRHSVAGPLGLVAPPPGCAAISLSQHIIKRMGGVQASGLVCYGDRQYSDFVVGGQGKSGCAFRPIQHVGEKVAIVVDLIATLGIVVMRGVPGHGVALNEAGNQARKLGLDLGNGAVLLNVRPIFAVFRPLPTLTVSRRFGRSRKLHAVVPKPSVVPLTN